METERYKVTLAYDGTSFFGFQRQGETRTVQLEVEAALRKLNWQGRTILSSGRTDTGVHATGQVVAFDLQWEHGLERLQRALNANLPKDVVVKAVEIAPAGFHPRYDAVSRTYYYYVQFGPIRDPLRDRYVWRIWPPCAIDRLQAAARLLQGIHDFVAFGTPPRPGGITIRNVFHADWQSASFQNEEDSILRFEVTANAFLYHMVRRMVFVQVLVGQQRLSLDALEAAVANPYGGAALPPGLALPQGLVLHQVRYGQGSPTGQTESAEDGQVTQEIRNTLQ